MDTSKTEKTIMPQKGIKFYLGLNTRITNTTFSKTYGRLL